MVVVVENGSEEEHEEVGNGREEGASEEVAVACASVHLGPSPCPDVRTRGWPCGAVLGSKPPPAERFRPLVPRTDGNMIEVLKDVAPLAGVRELEDECKGRGEE